MAYLVTKTILAGGGPVGVAVGRFRPDTTTAHASPASDGRQAPASPSPLDLVLGYEAAIHLMAHGVGAEGGGGGDGIEGAPNTQHASPPPTPTRCPRTTHSPLALPCTPDPAAPAGAALRQRVRGGLVALATLPAAEDGAAAADALLLLTGDGRLVSVAWSGMGSSPAAAAPAAALGAPGGGRFVETGAVDLAGEEEGEDEDEEEEEEDDGDGRGMGEGGEDTRAAAPPRRRDPAAAAAATLSAAARAPTLMAVDDGGRAVLVAARSGAAWLLFREAEVEEAGAAGARPHPPTPAAIPGLSAPTRFSGGPDGPLGPVLAAAWVPAGGSGPGPAAPTAVLLSMCPAGRGTAALHLVWRRQGEGWHVGAPAAAAAAAAAASSLASRIIRPGPCGSPCPDPVPYGMTVLPCGASGAGAAPAALVWQAGRLVAVALDTGAVLASVLLPSAAAPTPTHGRREVPVGAAWVGGCGGGRSGDGRGATLALALASGRVVGLEVRGSGDELRLRLLGFPLSLPPSAVLAPLPCGRALALAHSGPATVLSAGPGGLVVAVDGAASTLQAGPAPPPVVAAAAAGGTLYAACQEGGGGAGGEGVSDILSITPARPVELLAATAPGTAPGVTGLWSASPPPSSSSTSGLPRSAAVVSFADASRALVLGPDAALGDGTAALGMSDGERTVAFGRVSGGGGEAWADVQVTPSRARRLAWRGDAGSPALSLPLSTAPLDWLPPPGVTIGAAAVLPGGVLVSTSDGRGVSLLVVGSGTPAPSPPALAARLALEAEVSCLHACATPCEDDGSFLALAGTYASSVVLLAVRLGGDGGGGLAQLARLATLGRPPPRAVPWAWEGPAAAAAAAAAAGGGGGGGSGNTATPNPTPARLAGAPPPPPPDVPESVLLVRSGGGGRGGGEVHALIGWRSGLLAHAAVVRPSGAGGLWALTPVTTTRLGGLPLTLREVGGGGKGAPPSSPTTRAVVAGGRAALVSLPAAGAPAGMTVDRLDLPPGTAHVACVAVPDGAGGGDAALLTADRAAGGRLRVVGLDCGAPAGGGHHPRLRRVEGATALPGLATHIAAISGASAVAVALAAAGRASVAVVVDGGGYAAAPAASSTTTPALPAPAATFRLQSTERVTALRAWDVAPALAASLAGAAARKLLARREGEQWEEEAGMGAEFGGVRRRATARAAATATLPPRPGHALVVGTAMDLRDDSPDERLPPNGRLLLLWLSAGVGGAGAGAGVGVGLPAPSLTLTILAEVGIQGGVFSVCPVSRTALAVGAGSRLAVVALREDTAGAAHRWVRLGWRATARPPLALERGPPIVAAGVEDGTAAAAGSGGGDGGAFVAVTDPVSGAAAFAARTPPPPLAHPRPGGGPDARALAAAAMAAGGGAGAVPGLAFGFPPPHGRQPGRPPHPVPLPAVECVGVGGAAQAGRGGPGAAVALPVVFPLDRGAAAAAAAGGLSEAAAKAWLGLLVGDGSGRLAALAPTRPGSYPLPAAASDGPPPPPPPEPATPERNLPLAAEVDLVGGAVVALLASELKEEEEEEEEEEGVEGKQGDAMEEDGSTSGGAAAPPPLPAPPAAWVAATASGSVHAVRPLAPPHWAVLACVQAALEAGLPGLAPLGSATATAAAGRRQRACAAGRNMPAAAATPPASPGAAPPPFLPGMSPPPAWPVGPPPMPPPQAAHPLSPPPMLDGDTLAALLAVPEASRAGVLVGARPPAGVALPGGSVARAAAMAEAACPLAASAAVAAALAEFD